MTEELQPLTNTGNVALWVGFLGNAFSTLGFIYSTRFAKHETFIFYNINTVICGIASVCYLLMTLGMSNYYTAEGDLVLWARYLEFILATPLLLVDLGLVAGATIPELFYICMCDIMMIACGWWASTAPTLAARWIFFACGSFFYVPIVGTILGTLRTEVVNQRTTDVVRLYTILSAYTVFVWSAYPILWILHDGFHLIDINVECVIHTILDILAKGVFGSILLYSHGALEHTPVHTITDTDATNTDATDTGVTFVSVPTTTTTTTAATAVNTIHALPPSPVLKYTGTGRRGRMSITNFNI